MNPWRFLIDKLKSGYSVVWHATGDRPWTYRIRALVERWPKWGALIITFTVVGLVVGQMVLVQSFGWKALPFVLWADFMAFTAGHLFWDTAGSYLWVEVDND